MSPTINSVLLSTKICTTMSLKIKCWFEILAGLYEGVTSNQKDRIKNEPQVIKHSVSPPS